MAALTLVAIGARKAIRYTIFFIIFLTIGRILLVAGIGVYKKLFPAPPPPPTVKYGKLTKIPFPENPDIPKLNYILETPDGNFPKVPTQLKIYFIPKPNANLLALDVAKEKARNMGYLSQENQISDSLYEFQNRDYPVKLTMNIISGNFSISYDLSADRSPLDTKPSVSEVAASQFKSILASARVLPSDLTGPTTHEFYKLNNGQLINSISLSEADLTKVNLSRKSYDELPAVYANPQETNIWAIISGASNKNQQIIASEYKYYQIDETQASTYPIKSPDMAFGQLQAGNYFAASIGTNVEGGSVKIRRIYLAYFDPANETNFYQPVYVFEGDGNFVGYVPAVTSEYYGEQ